MKDDNWAFFSTLHFLPEVFSQQFWRVFQITCPIVIRNGREEEGGREGVNCKLQKNGIASSGRGWVLTGKRFCQAPQCSVEGVFDFFYNENQLYGHVGRIVIFYLKPSDIQWDTRFPKWRTLFLKRNLFS